MGQERKWKCRKNVVRIRCTVLYTKIDADLLVHLFLDGMKKLKLAYLPLAFLYNLNQS